jgi:large subunit ribosomal protein L13
MTPEKMTRSVRATDVEQAWWVVDATDKTVGRLASQVASVLRGKHKASFTPHVDCGDAVVVINADKIKIAPKRARMKEYRWYTGYPGGLRSETFEQAVQKHPERIVERAVKGMLPKNRLGRQIVKKLRVYAGADHPHKAQQPKVLELK